MEALIERFVFTNTRCYTCGALVYAMEKKKTANHVYHNRCFRCRICKRNLNGLSLNEEGDDIYCTNCYRKKQRGDCSGLDFQRATNERAQYVHNRRHPDQPPPKSNPQPPIQRDRSRHPSWTLHQLERRFLSYQEPNTQDFKKFDSNYRQLMSVPPPSKLKTSFSVPNNLTNIRRHSSLTKNELSPSLEFLPVFSPSPMVYTGPTAKSLKKFEQFNGEKRKDKEIKLTNDLQSRSNRSSIDLSTPPTERKPSIMIDVNQKHEKRNKTPSKFHFLDTHITPIHRRSSSISYSISPRKIK